MGQGRRNRTGNQIYLNLYKVRNNKPSIVFGKKKGLLKKEYIFLFLKFKFLKLIYVYPFLFMSSPFVLGKGQLFHLKTT